jgi:tRNA1(Val) A37 N6-methylase TrmN6
VNLPEEIHVLDRKVKLYQPAKGGFRTSLDSVMLAAACPARNGERVLDAGCGVGGASFCLLWRVPGIRLTGVEWQESYIELARENNALNGRDAEFVLSDIRAYQPETLYDHVMINPPYLEAGRHTPSPDDVRAQALGHQISDLTLEDWIRAAHRLLRSAGTLTLIYPAHGANKIILALGRKFGAVEIIPLWPRAGQEAKRVIIRAIKDRQTPSRIFAGLTLHEDNGAYTAEAERVLRDGDRIE